MAKKICGVRPTGPLHLGHFLSVIEPARQTGCDVLIADLHAPGCSSVDIARTVQTLARYGVSESKLYVQSRVFDYRLFFMLATIAPLGQLHRMTQFKAAGEDKQTTHMLLYPIMMAVDVFGYDTVYVGEDQQQHIEFARDLIEKFNSVYESENTLPKGEPVGGRIMNLRKPLEKMSSSSPEGCIFLTDSAKTIREKVMHLDYIPDNGANLRKLATIMGVDVNMERMGRTKEALGDAIVGCLGVK